MQKLLINSLGQTFFSREQNNFSIKENKFVWKQNIKKISRLKISQSKSIFRNQRHSKKGQRIFTLYKKIDHKYNKLVFMQTSKIEQFLIQKGLLHFQANGEQIEFRFLDNNIQKQYYDLQELVKLQKCKNEVFRNEMATKIDFNQKVIIGFSNQSILAFNQKKDALFQLIRNATKITSSRVENRFQPVAKTKRIICREFIRQLPRNLKMVKNDIRKLLQSELKAGYWLRAFTGSNVLKVRWSEIVQKHVKGLESKSYDYELMYKKALSTISYEKQIIKLKSDFVRKAILLQKQIQAAKPLDKKAFIREYQSSKTELKNEYQIIWRNLKSGKSSKQAKRVERKKYFSKRFILRQNLILKHSPQLTLKRDFKDYVQDFKTAKQKLARLKTSELNSHLRTIPVELRIWKYYTSIFLEALFPGLGSLINKKYLKAIILLPVTTAIVVVLFWIFGAFPSATGNGIIGLIDFGHDPQTASGINIGVTNGIPHDARFFLVTGVIALIFLAFAIMYWIITFLSNVNSNNLAKLGVRYNNWKETKKLLQTQGLPYLLSIPAIIFITFLVILPILATVFISFTNFNERIWDPHLKRFYLANGWSKPFKWVGFDQYNKIFDSMSNEFQGVLLWTILWTFGSTTLTIVIGTLMAVLVNQNRIKFKTLFRVIYILPWAVPAFITIMFLSLFFQYDGTFNKVIGNKLFAPDTDWKDAHYKTKLLIIMIQAWLGHSYMFLLITGMLQAIPKSLYEASRMDGASSIFQFRTITVPIITSKILPLLIGQFTFNFYNFGLIYLFNEGGNPIYPGGAAGEYDILISWVYKLINGGVKNSPGAAAAISLLISIFTIAPSALIFLKSKSFRKGDF